MFVLIVISMRPLCEEEGTGNPPSLTERKPIIVYVDGLLFNFLHSKTI